MTCKIRVIHGDLSIDIDVIADSGCQEELALEEADIGRLNLLPVGTHDVVYPDGSTGPATIYGNVTVEVTLSDGSIVRAEVVPSVLERVSDGVGLIGTERILGYSALDKLNLKLDFRKKMLVKRIRRI